MFQTCKPGSGVIEAGRGFRANGRARRERTTVQALKTGLRFGPPTVRRRIAVAAPAPEPVNPAATLAAFRAEAIRRAEAAGYRPAESQREVDWAWVRDLAGRAADGAWAWKTIEQQGCGEHILVAGTPDGWKAVLSGQHRILAGLMAGNPVPDAAIDLKTWMDAAKPWA
jgi:hypothetical protein